MKQKRTLGRIAARTALASAVVLAVAVPLVVASRSQAATAESLTVDLASTRGTATGVGEGFLYGISQDGTLPADQYLQPLGITAFRGGGWFSGGWIKDNYQYGSATQADIASITAQAKRLTRSPYHAQYQVLLTDLYGLNGGQPSTTTYPCDNGNCTNWATFIDTTVAALQATGLTFAYDIDNEPDISVFWKAGVNTTQYFQMWDTAYKEIRKVAPNAQIVGPSFAYTPQARASQWSTWLAHVKAAGTVPDMITNHDEGDVDDPVTVAQALNSQLTAAGIGTRPLSANEYQPADRQTAGVTAWYLARFAQSGYTNAMRGNWVCCMTPNLTGVLTQSGTTWAPNGNWWAMRRYADLTGTLVNTSGQVGSTAISASIDSSAKRAVAIIGDSNGYTGTSSVTFNGLSSLSWLAGSGTVNVVVERIPDQAPLTSPQVVVSQNMSTSSGSINVPFTFQASHDAFAITVTPVGGPTTSPTTSPTASPTTAPTTSPTTAPTSSSSPTSTGGCTATYAVTNSWTGGFQANVTVLAGSTALKGWTVSWTFPNGQTVSQLWNGSYTQSGATVTVTNASYNGSVAAGASTTFGFLGSTSGSNNPPSSMTCSAS